jgi:hypothetical protein
MPQIGSGLEGSVSVSQWPQAAQVDLAELFGRHHAELVRLAVLVAGNNC